MASKKKSKKAKKSKVRDYDADDMRGMKKSGSMKRPKGY